MRSVFARIGAWCVERPGPVIALAVLLAIIGAVGALSLEPDGEAETLVDEGSETFEATERFKESFGDDPVYVLIQGDLEQLVLTEDLKRILFLESCLAGTAPADQLEDGRPTPAVCNELAAERPARVVYGPATVLNQFAEQARTLFEAQQADARERAQLAARSAFEAAREGGLSRGEANLAGQQAAEDVLQGFIGEIRQIGTQYGQLGLPSIDSPTFVQPIVFDSRLTDGTPKAKFSYLFPSSDSALIQVRLRPELDEAERAQAIDLIREVVTEDAFRIRNSSYVVSGIPVIADGLTDEIASETTVLLVAALLVMALVLALVFAPPLRLLPLGVGLVASAISFGALALFGGSLTMASIAGLPVLIGLAVDYAIQLQARFTEARAGGASSPRAAAQAAASGGPVIATAGLATAAGFMVLLLSPIPMVRSFGVLLVAGILIAFGLALTAGLAILSFTSGAAAPPAAGGRRFALAPRFAARSPRAPAFVVRLREAASRLGPASLAASIAMPGRVLAIGVLVAATGWVAGTRTEIVSDLRQLVPASLPELQDVDVLEDETGVSGPVDVAVTADDITDPEVVSWMRDYRERVLALGGFDGASSECLDPQTSICPGPALPELFGEGEVPSQERIQGLLSLLPPYFSQALVETDLETGEIGDTAVLSFGIKVMPFDEQKQLIDQIRAAVDRSGEGAPPEGVDVEVVGLPVLVADANAALGSNRYLLTFAGLLAVALVLFCVYRSVRRTLIPLVPVFLAPGWSALVLEGASLDLNPMSATLGALVIAIATQFSVLLTARYYEEREGGASVGEALRLSYSRTGVAVVASGTTAIAGFAVLALAAPIQLLFGGDAIRMLTEFGVVGVIDLLVALAGVLLVLPAVLVWAEGDFATVRSTLARLRGRRVEAGARKPVSDSIT